MLSVILLLVTAAIAYLLDAILSEHFCMYCEIAFL